MTFYIGLPLSIGAAQIDYTNVAEPSDTDPTTLWSSATTYTAGQTVYSATSHRAYQATGLATNLNKDPSIAANVAPPNAATPASYFWLDMGATNKFRPFDQSTAAQAKVTGGRMRYRLKINGSVSTVALFGIRGSVAAVSHYATGVARRNLITYSADPTNAVYASNGLTITGNALQDHLGGFSMATIQETAANSTHLLQTQAVSFTSGLVYTVSAYVKRIPLTIGRDVQLRFLVGAFSTTPQANFDMSALTVSTSGGATAGISGPNAQGYYRISMTATCDTTASARVNLYIYNGGITYLGNGSSGFSVSGIQVEQGALSAYQWIEDATRWGDVSFGRAINVSQVFSTNAREDAFTGLTAVANDFIDITINPESASTIAALAEVALAYAYPIGDLVGPSTVGIVDYSTQGTDTFGNSYTVRRTFANRADYIVRIKKSYTAQIRNFLASFRTNAALFYDDQNLTDWGTTVYGRYTDFNIPITGSAGDLALMTLSVQGIS